MRTIMMFLAAAAFTIAACAPVETSASSGAVSGVGGGSTSVATGAGGNGGSCGGCDDGNPCTSDFCESGECKHAAYTSKIPCSADGSKMCVGGVCQ